MPIDYKRYPPNWKTEIVPAVIARAGNCCEECGAPNHSMQWRGRKEVDIVSVHGRKRKGWTTNHYESKEAAIADGCEWWDDTGYTEEYKKNTWNNVYQTKVILTIAHLDHDETNWDVQLDRLKALCQLHHLKMDAAEKYRRSLIKTP